MNPRILALHRLALSGAAIAACAASGRAQFTFSIDWNSPTIGMPNTCTGVPITEGDILSPVGGFPAFGPLPPPCIAVSGGFAPPGLGLPAHPGCVGHPPGVPCGVEVDALSYGADQRVIPSMRPGSFKFSVDQFAIGIIGSPIPPAVWTESIPGVDEAPADTFVDLIPLGVLLPICPAAVAPIAGNRGFTDGNGLVSTSGFVYRGIGLFEPAPPIMGPIALGDNLDAVDVDGPIAAGGGIYFSLDAAFFDPARGVPNSGSAFANGFLPGMILVTLVPGGPPVVYTVPPMLGLDLAGPPGSDDLDALALLENGIAGYQPAPPFAWGPGGGDMVLFSVRRGSMVIGLPASNCGAPIEPGDILMPPVAGGVSPFPAILIPAEVLGLATARGAFAPLGDDLDALDVTAPIHDCNGNGIEDVVDIAMGAADCNSNGIPDSCEPMPSVYCVPKLNSLGCLPTISFSGAIPSATCPLPFNIKCTMVRNNKPGLLFYSVAGPAAIPFQCGTLCVAAPIRRTGVQVSGGTPAPANDCSGTFAIDFNAHIQSGLDPTLVAGATVYTQWWGRDPGFPAPCNTMLSDALKFLINM